jgi:hypothetical protein
MKKNDTLMLVAVLGGGYLLYWYLTNYGPNGQAVPGSGQTWWDQWFGGMGSGAGTGSGAGAGAAVPPGAAIWPNASAVSAGSGSGSAGTGSTGTNTGTNTSTSNTNQGSNEDGGYAPVNSQPPATLYALIAQAAGGDHFQYNAHQWNYYRNMVAPPDLTPQQFGLAFGAQDQVPMSLTQFLQRLQSAGLVGMSGLGEVVAVPDQPSLPDLAFNRKGNFAPKTKWTN